MLATLILLCGVSLTLISVTSDRTHPWIVEVPAEPVRQPSLDRILHGEDDRFQRQHVIPRFGIPLKDLLNRPLVPHATTPVRK